ncbi:MAG TPA: DCC1-like thiol-disulfide oxidoreductase family protein [Saprospiraceae bacterium]|nr:DCC1-like thiol-disulfide oxidoreductase family protein [Saprospiraceae bacterium]
MITTRIDINHIIIYDGECNYCDAIVQFLIRVDKNNDFKFAHISSQTGSKLLNKFGIDSNLHDSFIYVKDQEYYMYSNGAGQVLLQLGGAYALMGKILLAIPLTIRDAIYKWVARNRYKLFGRKQSCDIPSKSILDKFLV